MSIDKRVGVDLIGGGVDSRGGYDSKILYVKMKELGPLGLCLHRQQDDKAPLADLGGHARHVPPLRVPILSF